MTMPQERRPSLSDPKAVADAGERIYERQYRADFEKQHPGRFVAIDVLTEKAFLGDRPEEALQRAKEANPQGIFHLIRVGAPGAFRVSRTSHASGDWVLR
jgi:hypothetical protein